MCWLYEPQELITLKTQFLSLMVALTGFETLLMRFRGKTHSKMLGDFVCLLSKGEV